MQHRFQRFIILAAFTLGLIAATANAGPLIVSGDSNIIQPLYGGLKIPLDPGNWRFFQNILSGGSKVVIQYGQFDQSEAQLVNGFYTNILGVSSSLLTLPLSANSLGGADLLISIMPDSAYTASETAALQSFLDTGGTVFFIGENSVFSAQNAAINSDLTALGSSLRIVDDVFDDEFHTATGPQIVSDPLTTGISTFSYAAPSRVTGGTTLFFGTDRRAFLAYEGGAPPSRTPEPATMILLGTGLAGLGAAVRKRRDR